MIKPVVRTLPAPAPYSLRWHIHKHIDAATRDPVHSSSDTKLLGPSLFKNNGSNASDEISP